MNRRDLLKGIGGGLGALGLHSLMGPAHAAASGGVRRMIVFYTNNGTVQTNWKMTPRSLASDVHWSMALPSSGAGYSLCLEGLAPIADRVMVVDGLGLVTAELDRVAAGTRHETGNLHAMTGGWGEMIGNWPTATAPSIDQLVASAIAAPGQYRSMEWGVGNTFHEVNYRDRRLVLPSEYDLHAIENRLFGGRGASGEGTASLLQSVSERYLNLSKRMSSVDRQKLETHRQLLREIEVRQDGLAARQATCLDVPDVSDQTLSYDEKFEQMLQLLQTSFSCDLTRVLTLNMGQHPMKSLTGRSGDLHDEFAHDIYISDEADDVMTRNYQRHVANFTKLVQTLDAMTDPLGDGLQTLLDNTLVVWVGELGDSTHNFDQLPVVVAGGRSFSDFRLGEYVRLPAITPVSAWSFAGINPTMGVPNQHLLVNIAQAMGVDTDHVGLAEATTEDGHTLDLRGGVPELLRT